MGANNAFNPNKMT